MMNKDTSAIALVLVTLLLLFIALQPILPANNEKFSELGILGPNQTISNYPTTVVKGQTISLYGYVGNHEGQVEFYKVVVKLGNNATVVSNSTAANAPEMASYSHILENNQSWTFPVSLMVETPGTNLRIIFELWALNSTTSDYSYLGLWNQMWLNVTAK